MSAPGSKPSEKDGFRLPALNREQTRRYLWLLVGTAPLAFVLVVVDAFLIPWLPAMFYIGMGAYLIWGYHWAIVGGSRG